MGLGGGGGGGGGSGGGGGLSLRYKISERIIKISTTGLRKQNNTYKHLQDTKTIKLSLATWPQPFWYPIQALS